MDNKIFEINQFLIKSVKYGASDVHLMIGEPPFIRKNGAILRVDLPILNKEDFDKILDTIILKNNNNNSLTNVQDKDFIYEITDVARFRVNYCLSFGRPELVIRIIPLKIPTLEMLGLPTVVSSFKHLKNGIVFITGPTGSGKSTTLSSIIEEINQQYAKHIITIEDPIEFFYKSKKSRITQRSVGLDTSSYLMGLKYALRQDPDIIMVGEIRDKNTMDIALQAAETGHLVFATLHTNDAVQSINRIINLFDESNRSVIRKQLAESFRANVAQQLVYSSEHGKRFLAYEIMLVTPTIKDYILKAKNDEIYDLISQNVSDGMISMNRSLALLVEKELITKEEALEASSCPEELEKLLRDLFYE